MMNNKVLSVNDLRVTFETFETDVYAVRGVDYDLYQGETLAIVGESGSGKSVSTKAVNGLLPENAVIESGSIMFEGQDLLQVSEKEMQNIRGRDIAMIFQDPMTSLNPTMTVGRQIAEPMIKHLGYSQEVAGKRSIELMRKVGIRNPEESHKQFPHQFSGGMRQRVMIAIALACRPKILIADEPTTALDVTIQAQILELMNDLKEEMDMSIIFITHDLGVVAQTADRIAVMYAGKIVEIGTAEEIFFHPQHPYTWGLLASIPSLDENQTKLYTIPGSPPNMTEKIEGDAFAPRNAYAMEIDFVDSPPFFQVSDTHFAKTWLLDEYAPKVRLPKEIEERYERFYKKYPEYEESKYRGVSYVR